MLLFILMQISASLAAPLELAAPEEVRPRILYGIHTSAKPAYRLKRRAQIATWQSTTRSRVLAIGPRCQAPNSSAHAARRGCAPKTKDGKVLYRPSHCEDHQMWCKVLAYMREAAAYAAVWDFDWLFGINEDQYVVERKLKAVLRRHNPREISVVATIGCGRRWNLTAESKGGTLPMPRSWNEDTRPSCDLVKRHGCFCGGDGIAWSRAAVLALMQGELDTTQMDPNATVDATMGCIAHAKNIRRYQKPWAASEIYYTRLTDIKREVLAVYHLRAKASVVANQMRAVHAEYQ